MSDFTNNPIENPPQSTEDNAGSENASVISTLEQLSQWIDADLMLLECRHQSFETQQSQRLYFQR